MIEITLDQDETVVSCEVTSLSMCIPTQMAKIMKKCLYSQTNFTLIHICPLLYHCLTTIHFQYSDGLYNRSWNRNTLITVKRQNHDTTSSPDPALWAVSNTTLTPQRLFANSPPLFVHTERNTTVKTNRCIIHTESQRCGPIKRHDSTRHDDDMCVFKGFPQCLPCQSKPDGGCLPG